MIGTGYTGGVLVASQFSNCGTDQSLASGQSSARVLELKLSLNIPIVPATVWLFTIGLQKAYNIINHQIIL